tara:strand:+ start:699 stop:845 length:147 start_codon:yes stop_codon:yes gene_type:complete
MIFSLPSQKQAERAVYAFAGFILFNTAIEPSILELLRIVLKAPGSLLS